MSIYKHIKGDATKPIGDGNKIIVHVCNNCIPGKWGAGFVLSLSKKWTKPEIEYRKWSRGQCDKSDPYELGQIQFVKVEDDIAVCNMLAQEGVGFSNGKPPIRYDALQKCLWKVEREASKCKASVHLPFLMGCGLAGGDWGVVIGLINTTLCDNDVDVTVYEYHV